MEGGTEAAEQLELVADFERYEINSMIRFSVFAGGAKTGAQCSIKWPYKPKEKRQNILSLPPTPTETPVAKKDLQTSVPILRN